MSAWNPLLLTAAMLMLAGSSIASAQPDPKWMECSRKADNTPLAKTAYEQIALFRTCKASWMNPGGPDILSMRSGDAFPARKLLELGLDALPVLVEALDDTTPTNVLVPSRHHPIPEGEITEKTPGVRIWKVNEFVVLIIYRIADYHFVTDEIPLNLQVPSGKELQPASIALFRKAVLDWHAVNRNRTIEERKIAALNDDWFRNRMDAVEWLGENRVTKGVPEIIRLVDRLLAEKERNSLQDTELADAAMALAKIGDKSALPSVIRICDSLQESLKSYSPGSEHPAYRLGRASQARTMLDKQ